MTVWEVFALVTGAVLGLALLIWYAGWKLSRRRPRAREVVLGILAVVVVGSCTAGALSLQQWVLGRRATDGQPPMLHTAAPVSPSDTLYAMENGSVVALSARDGSVRWRHAVTSSASTVFRATVSGDTIYIAALPIDTTETFLIALRSSDGSVIWRNNAVMPSPNGQEEHPFLEMPPLVADGMVYLSIGVSGPSAIVEALYVRDGTLAWTRTEVGVDDTGDGLLFGGSTAGGLAALHARDGAMVWHAGYDGSPVYANGVVYVTDTASMPGEQQLAVRLVALRAPDGVPLWSVMSGDDLPNHVRSVTPSGTHLYVLGADTHNGGYHSYLYAYDATTGQLAWKQPDLNVFGRPLEAGGVAYLGDNDELLAFRARDGALIWRQRTESPALMYVRFIALDDVLYAQALDVRGHADMFCDCSKLTSLSAMRASDGALYWRTYGVQVITAQGVDVT